MLGLIARRCITSSTNIVDQLSEFYIKELDFKPRTRDDREDLYYDDVLESVQAGRDHVVPLDLSSSDEDDVADDDSDEDSEDPFFTDTNHKALTDL